MTPGIWTIVGVGKGLAGLGTGGFTLLWRYIAAAEKRSEDRSAAVERRAQARFADLRADMKADIQSLADRMERNHADVRRAILRFWGKARPRGGADPRWHPAASRLENRFDRLETRFDQMDERLGNVEQEFGRVDQRLATLEHVILPPAPAAQ